MWNKRVIILFVIGITSCLGAFPQDSVVSVPHAPDEIIDDTLHVVPDAKIVYPNNLSQLQRDSIIDVIPKDSSSITSLRHFDGDLVGKYASDKELNYERNVNKSLLQRLKEMIGSWLDRLLGKPDSSRINNLSDIILDILLVLVFLVAVYILVRLFMNHRGRWFFEKKNESVAVNLSNVEQHIHEADFSALLKEAEQIGDARQSVRLLYLWLLKTLADDNVIVWNPDKTNVDYLVEIKDKALQDEFRYLSYLYNNIWYGEFSLNDSEYRSTRETFLRHIKINPDNE